MIGLFPTDIHITSMEMIKFSANYAIPWKLGFSGYFRDRSLMCKKIAVPLIILVEVFIRSV